MTTIGDYAFFECEVLTNVTIPNSVTSLGGAAFEYCDSLTDVTIGSGVTNIGDGAFSECLSLNSITVNTSNPVYSSVAGVLFNKSQTALMQYPAGNGGTSYTIPSSVTSIGDEAFEHSDSLTNVTIPNSVTNIGDGAFSECTSLTSITVNTNNPAYSSVAGVLFNKSQTALLQYPAGKDGIPFNGGTFYQIPNSVTNIGNWGFAGSSLSSITIPNGVVNIGDQVFVECFNLISVTIPKSITYIGDGAHPSLNDKILVLTH